MLDSHQPERGNNPSPYYSANGGCSHLMDGAYK